MKTWQLKYLVHHNFSYDTISHRIREHTEEPTRLASEETIPLTHPPHELDAADVVVCYSPSSQPNMMDAVPPHPLTSQQAQRRLVVINVTDPHNGELAGTPGMQQREAQPSQSAIDLIAELQQQLERIRAQIAAELVLGLHATGENEKRIIDDCTGKFVEQILREPAGIPRAFARAEGAGSVGRGSEPPRQ